MGRSSVRLYTLPSKWRDAITEILLAPVPEPIMYQIGRRTRVASGEIDTAPTKDKNQMWNQQNGNGGGYDQVMQRLNGTKPVEERDPFITPGSHQGVVVSLTTFDHKDHGPSVRLTMEYIGSSNPQLVGTACVKLFNLFRRPKFESQTSDADEFVDFVCKLQGVKLGQHSDAVRALIKTQAEGGQLELQPARGARINFTGTEVGKVNDKGQRFVKVAFFPAENDMAGVAMRRADLDARRPLGMTQGAPVQQAAPQGYPQQPGGQFQQAPQMQAVPQVQGATGGWGGYGAPQPAPQMQQAAPPAGNFGQYVQAPAAPQMQPAPALQPSTGVAPWNPAWGPKPVGYPG